MCILFLFNYFAHLWKTSLFPLCLIYSNPGNPCLWALLSRVVPQYYPRKANVNHHASIPSWNLVYAVLRTLCTCTSTVDCWTILKVNLLSSPCFSSQGGAMAGEVACLSSMTQGKVNTGCISHAESNPDINGHRTVCVHWGGSARSRTMFFVLFQRALLYSGVNQLASGTHSGEHRHRNALKTMQRAVFLCPGIRDKIHLRCAAVKMIWWHMALWPADKGITANELIFKLPVFSVYFQMMREPGQDWWQLATQRTPPATSRVPPLADKGWSRPSWQWFLRKVRTALSACWLLFLR